MNAITVAADLIQKRIKESAVLEKDNVIKRIILVTDLLSPVGHSSSPSQPSILKLCHIPLQVFSHDHDCPPAEKSAGGQRGL